MKILLTMATALALAAPSLCAIDFQVTNIVPLEVSGIDESFHPVFSNDGQSLIVSTEAYNGLGVIDLKDGKYRQLSDREGAGYRFSQDNDGRILLRENDFLTQKISLYIVDVETGKEMCIAPVVEHVNVLKFNDGVVAYGEPVARKVMTHVDPEVLRPMSVETAAKQTILTEEDLKLVLYIDGERHQVDPIMDTFGVDQNYCWSSLSPDGTKMAFVAGNDAFTCNLDGSNLVNHGPIHAPVWRGNNTIIGMHDTDDGHFFLTSDIVAADIRTGEVVQLTPISDEIKMFPSVSPDGSQIAYHTTEGKIYIINVTNK